MGAQVMSLQIITLIFAISVAVALHERLGSVTKFVISFPSPFCLYLKFHLANCEAWEEFMNPWENRPNKMAKEMHSKQHKFRGFPEISWSFIYTYSHSKEKWQCGMSMV